MIQRWSKPADPSSLELLQQLQTKMKLKRKLRLVVCRQTATPCAMGLIRPTIILPDQKWEPEELSLILTHELIHIHQNDCWVRLLCLIARVVYWFNPVVYLLEMHLNQYCEQACDEAVIKNCSREERHQYGCLLIKQARGKGQLPLLSTGFGLRPKQIQERLTLIMNQNYFKLNWEKVLIAAALVMMTGCVIKEKEIRNFLAAPLANREPINGEIYASSQGADSLEGQALTKESSLIQQYRELHQYDSIQQYNEGINSLIHSIKSNGFELKDTTSIPRYQTLMELPYSITMDVPYTPVNQQPLIFTILYTQDGDNSLVSLNDEERCYNDIQNSFKQWIDQLSEEQITELVEDQNDPDIWAALEERFGKIADPYELSVSQVSLYINQTEIEEPIEIYLDIPWKELQEMSLDEIRKKADMRVGKQYVVITSDQIKIHNLDIVRQNISSICENKEAGISVQAYLMFSDDTSIRQLMCIPNLKKRVDKVLNEYLSALQETDHENLRANLHEAILKELDLTAAPIIISIVKDY